MRLQKRYLTFFCVIYFDTQLLGLLYIIRNPKRFLFFACCMQYNYVLNVVFTKASAQEKAQCII
jgi:hypothetical protein